MAIRKLLDIANESNSRFDRFKTTSIKKTIEERFDTGSHNDNPYDDAIQFLKEKLDEIIETNNDKIVGKTPLSAANNLSDIASADTARSNLGLGTAATTAAGSYATSAQGTKANTAHGWGNHASAGYGTSNLEIGTTGTTAKAGNTTTISTSQASAITANTAKTGISTSQASAITANSAKTGITSTQASQITANNAKVGTETDLAPTTEGGVLKATVAENRGTYTLTFTFTTSDGRTTKRASIAMS